MVIREGAKNTPKGGANFWGTSLFFKMGGVDQLDYFGGDGRHKNGGRWMTKKCGGGDTFGEF